MSLRSTLEARRTVAHAELTALLVAPETEERDLSPEETTTFGTLRDEIRSLDGRMTDLADIEARRVSAAAAATSLQGTATGGARVTSEPAVYDTRSGRSLICDLYAAQMHGDPEARERIVVHNRQMRAAPGMERRDVGTGAFGALIPTQFLVDLWAPLARAGRPFASSIRRIPLPPTGTVFNIPRITTGTAVAAQATENAAVQETDIDETTLVVNMRTIAGMQDISRQSLERGEMIDQVVYGDLVEAYAAELDRQTIATDGTGGTFLGLLSTVGINAITYTDATPTVGEAYPKIADAIQQVNSNRFFPATLIAMHPRRWGWFTAAVDSQNRPLVVPNANMPQNAVGVGDPAAYGLFVGSILGVPVITDANIPTNLGAGTNEDRIIVTRAFDNLLWEDGDGAPMQMRFDQTLGGNLTVKLVVYGYAAFTAGRYPAASSVISGTGLVTPTF